MTDRQEIELELRGRSCFIAALHSTKGMDLLETATTLEKEGALITIVERAREFLAQSIVQLEENLNEEELQAVNRGISLACEEWVRTPEDRQLLGV